MYRPKQMASIPFLPSSLSRARLILYVLVMCGVAALAYGGLSGLLLDSDDAGYLRDAAAVRQDISLLMSGERAMTGRPVVELLFLAAHAMWGEHPGPYHLLLAGLHLMASFVLARLFWRLGADVELSLAASLLFLINVAHFRAVQWISCIAYPLALIVAAAAVMAWVHHLRSRRLPSLLAANLALLVAMGTHPATAAIVPFCLYLSWRYQGSLRQALRPIWPLSITTAAACWLFIGLFPEATHLTELANTRDPLDLLLRSSAALPRYHRSRPPIFRLFQPR